MALEEGVLIPWDAGILDAMFECVRVLFSLAHRPKDPGPNSCILVDWLGSPQLNGG